MIEFILNNKKIRVQHPAGMTLLDFIRYEQNLTGTKIGCREGDCGACTVLLGRLVDGKVKYESMTSCITPLGNARAKHVVTVEGLNMDELTPAQRAIADYGGTQCGFCTVGFVVSLSGYCLTAENPTVEGVISAIDGNICRCTGYKSIERGAAALADQLKPKDLEHPVKWLVDNNFIPGYFMDIPNRLAEIEKPKPKATAPVFVGGGTDLYVQRHDELHDEDIGFLFDRDELKGICPDGNNIVIRSAATATDMMQSEVMNTIFPNLYKHMKLVSSTPIRNMGTIAGNFVNASPIGDLTAYFLALDASIILTDEQKNERKIKLKDFYLGYKVLNKQPGESISHIMFEIPSKTMHFNFEKVCKRTYLDIASVNSAMLVEAENGVISSINISAGGVGPTPKFLQKTCDFLKGKEITESILYEANDIIQGEISPISDVRGSESYKRLLLRQLVFAHFAELFPESINPGELV